MDKALWVGVVLFCSRSILWAYDPSTADIAKVVGDRGGVRGGLGCGVDVGTGFDPFVRKTVSLNGPWSYILDPQDFGAAEFYKDLKQDGVRLVQHDFDRAPTMNVPTDWNSVDRSLLYYEGPMWLRRDFRGSDPNSGDFRGSDPNSGVRVVGLCENYGGRCVISRPTSAAI